MPKQISREKTKPPGMASSVTKTYEDHFSYDDRLGELFVVVQGLEAKLDEIHGQITGQLKPFYSVEEFMAFDKDRSLLAKERRDFTAFEQQSRESLEEQSAATREKEKQSEARAIELASLADDLKKTP